MGDERLALADPGLEEALEGMEPRILCRFVNVFEDPQHRVAAFRDPIVGLPRPPRDGQRAYEPALTDRRLDLIVGLVALAARVAVVLEDPVDGHGHWGRLDWIGLIDFTGRPEETLLHGGYG
jgi:hypothetical protein